MLICTCLNTSKISSNFEHFVGAVSLSRNGALGTNFWGLSLAIGMTVFGQRSLSSFSWFSSSLAASIASSGIAT
jgi:hypothetical protein